MRRRRRKSGREWRTYFEELLIEENPRKPLEETHPVEGPAKEITHNEIETAIQVKSSQISFIAGKIRKIGEASADTAAMLLN